MMTMVDGAVDERASRPFWVRIFPGLPVDTNKLISITTRILWIIRLSRRRGSLEPRKINQKPLERVVFDLSISLYKHFPWFHRLLFRIYYLEMIRVL
jgi:hypothetical protein